MHASLSIVGWALYALVSISLGSRENVIQHYGQMPNKGSWLTEMIRTWNHLAVITSEN